MPNTRRKAASGPPERDDSSIDHTISKFKVDMGYRMDYHDGHERIGHGQLLINNCWVNVSFLLCSSIKEQKQIFGNLSSVQHPSMVRVFLPLPEGVRMGGKELYPIAIERVSSTLNAFLDRYKQNIWKYGNLNSTSQQIARDMIDGMIFIHGKNKIHGRKTEDGITALDFVMVGDKVKFAFVYAENKMSCALDDLARLKGLDGSDLMKLFKMILDDPNKNPEWEHFKMQDFAHKLRFHPMLLDTTKRFLLPENTRMLLADFSGIRQRFNNVSSIRESSNNLTTAGVKDKNEKAQDKKLWSSNIPQGKLLDIYKYENYNPSCAYSRYNYIRNVCVHYPRDQGFSPGFVVFELNKIFPGYLCDIYDVFDKDYLARCCR